MDIEKRSNNFGGGEWASKWNDMIDQAYDKRERPRIEEFKQGNFNQYRNRPEMTRSRARKIGRLVLDLPVVKDIFVNLKRASDQVRLDEAQGEAYKEGTFERNEWLAAVRQKEEDAKRRYEDDERRSEAIKKARDDQELIKAMDELRHNKTLRIQGERKQEIGEKAFNDKLTKIRDIELMAEDEAMDAVSKRTLEYDGNSVTVYDVKDIPIKLLQHNLEYRTPASSSDRVDLSKTVQQDPSLWRKTSKEMEDSGVDGSNTLSMSYADMGKITNSIYKISEGKLVYGYDHLRPKTLLRVLSADAHTPLRLNKHADPFNNNYDSYLPESLEGVEEDPYPYNEVATLRYDEDGKPQEPDYIVAYNGVIPDNSLRHAAYYGIPVVNIEADDYLNKQIEDVATEIDTMDFGDDYEKIQDLLFRVRSLGKVVNGHFMDEKSQFIDEEKTQKYVRLMELEKKRRLEIIKDMLADGAYSHLYVTHQDSLDDKGQMRDKLVMQSYNNSYGDDNVPIVSLAVREDKDPELYRELSPLVNEFEKGQAERFKKSDQ